MTDVAHQANLNLLLGLRIPNDQRVLEAMMARGVAANRQAARSSPNSAVTREGPAEELLHRWHWETSKSIADDTRTESADCS